MAIVPVSNGHCVIVRSLLRLCRFDWFFKSRTPEELRRRGATLILCIMKDKENADDKEFKPKGGGSKKRTIEELKSAGSRDTTPSVQGKKSESSVSRH